MTEFVRLPDVPAGKLPPDLLESGPCYWKSGDGWRLSFGGWTFGNLDQHEVTEHEDGTITVSPSILVTSVETHRHGFLRRGVWEPCGDDRPDG